VWKGQVEVKETQNPPVLISLEIAPNGGPVVIEEQNLKPAVEHSDRGQSIEQNGTKSVTIRTAHDSAPELATKSQLERLLATHDLRQWTFTNEILIDEKSIPHSHPVLTLHTRHLKQDDELLSTYLHEQLHWFFTRYPTEIKAAEQDLGKLYPEVPVGYPEGANDTESTYLHLLVCRLEQRADLAVLGEQRTAAAMQFWAGDHYRWVYRTVLADSAKIDDIVKRHGLADPDARISAE
jgi:hypothetical protein